MKKLEDAIHYDPNTGLFTWKRSHGNRRVKDRVGTRDRYIKITIDRKQYLAHRLAWYLTHGKWPREIDHINRNKYDNRLCNLREVSSSENALNNGRLVNGCIRKVFKANSIRWHSQVKLNGVRYNIGNFKSYEEALKATIEFWKGKEKCLGPRL